jgi:uncharacterized repeat protein (TIGR01451 family)
MSLTTNIRFAGWALCALAGISAFGASAQAGGTLKLTNAVYQQVEIKAADGKITKKLVPAAKVVPGGEVVYEIEYNNTGKETANNVAITNPVPRELTFVDVVGAPVTAMSVDGGKQFGQLTDLEVTNSDGTKRPAQPTDVTTLRWVLPALKPGAQGKVSFRARVK